MPVPTNITDLSKVASDNSPQGTESARGTIDDYFRAGFAFDRQLFDLVAGATVVLPSAATVNIGFAAAIHVTITGTTTITAFDNIAEGAVRWVTFAGALTLTHNAASLQLPGAANIVTTAGDAAVFKSLGGGNWKCLSYQRISGTGPVAANAARDGYLSATDWAAFNTRLTPAVAAAAYLALAGGTMAGPVIFPNGIPIRMKDSAGNERVFAQVSSGNDVQFGNIGGNNWQVFNQASTAVIMNLSNAGDLTSRSHTSTSDDRLKKRRRRRPANFLQRIAGMRKVGDFTWRADGTPGIGGSAQELEAIWPEAVHTDADGFKSVHYGPAAFVIAAELARYTEQLERRLAALEGA